MSTAKKPLKKAAPAKAAARTPAPKKPAPKAPAKAKAAPPKPAAKLRAVPIPVPTPAPIAPAAPQAPQDGQQQPGVLSAEALANMQRLGAAAAADNPPAPGAEGEQQSPEEAAAAADEAERQRQIAAMGGQMMGGVAVAGIEKSLQFFYPFVQIPGEQKTGLQMSFAEVITKYGSSSVMPPWVVQYVLPFLEELKLLGKLGALIVGIVLQVQAENRRLEEDARKANEKNQNGNNGGGVDFSTAATA